MAEQTTFDAEQHTNGHSPNGRLTIRELEAGQRVAAVFAVRERDLRQKRNGEPFLRLVLGDSSGSIEAVCWEEAEDRYGLAEPGSALHVTGTFEQSDKWGAKIKVLELRPARGDEFSADDLAPGPQLSVDRLEADLRDLIETIQRPQLRELLDRFFGPGSAAWQRFREAPAAKYYHQAYRHGLLEHTVSVAQAVSAAAALFPGIDRDVAVTGGLLHDIGKTEAYNDDPLAIELTDAGRLHSEIPLGYYKVRREIEEIGGFDADLAQAVLHIILSHHGALEHGSP
ncbi:MAG TPA: HD domain-containing protein, partial [Solirubrobacteraceae bacterium]